MRPLTRTLPSLGCSRSAMMRRRVVLPQPEGPMNETNSPGATARSTPASAWTSPSAVSKVRETPRASTGGGDEVGVVIEGTLKQSPHVGDVALEVFDLPRCNVDWRQHA